MMNRTALFGMGTLLLISTMVASSAAQNWAGPQRPWREPHITFVNPPTPKAHEILVWAVDRFRQTGLQLPDLEIAFPVQCAGKGARYHVGKNLIEFCRVNKNRALHEFAHAWADTSGMVDREAFLEMRGLSVWRGGPDVPAAEQGTEQLAQIIAWGLLGFQERDLPQFPFNSVSELTAAFLMLTHDDLARDLKR